MIEHIFYHFLISLVTYGICFAAFKKSEGLAFLVTVGIGVLAVIFLFPDPVKTRKLSDLFLNIALLIEKGFFVATWGAGIYTANEIRKKHRGY